MFDVVAALFCSWCRGTGGEIVSDVSLVLVLTLIDSKIFDIRFCKSWIRVAAFTFGKMASSADSTVAMDLENAKVNGEIPIMTASSDKTSKEIDAASGRTRGTYSHPKQSRSGPLPSSRMSREDSPQGVWTIKSEYMIHHPPQHALLGAVMPKA